MTTDSIFPAKLWAIYKSVTRDNVWYVERAWDEKPFSSEKECQERVEKLNEGDQDKPYHYRPAEVLDLGGL
jgi:2-oxo-4-hydroxy-4-carboxy--5-ureidoimidazoline (OHCU) decarboxylase